MDRVQEYSTSAVDYFRVARAPNKRTNNHSLPQVRVPEELARAVADYGNAHGLSYSETVRSLLRRGLKQEES